MRKPGWHLFRLAAGLVACANLMVVDALAQSYPVRPIRMLVGYGPGGGADTTARLVAQKASEQLRQPVVVENRPGASGSMATEVVARAPADGYTLLMMASSGTVQSALRTNLPYDLERDLAAVALGAIGPFVLVVHPSVPARTIKDLVALARSQPGKLNYGSDGVGSSLHLAAALFCVLSKVNVGHVPYKGGAESAVATAAGHVDMMVNSIPAVLPLMKVGRLRVLAVTSPKRSSLLRSIPTLDESGLAGYERWTWYGVLAPAGVPKDVIVRLNAVINATANTPEMKEAFNSQGVEPQPNTPEKFAAFIHSEIAQNAKLVKLIGLKAE